MASIAMPKLRAGYTVYLHPVVACHSGVSASRQRLQLDFTRHAGPAPLTMFSVGIEFCKRFLVFVHGALKCREPSAFGRGAGADYAGGRVKIQVSQLTVIKVRQSVWLHTK